MIASRGIRSIKINHSFDPDHAVVHAVHRFALYLLN